MTWAGEHRTGSSNLSHRFRRAVIEGNLPLAKRLAATASSLSDSFASSSTTTRRTSAADTVRRHESLQDADHGLVHAGLAGGRGGDLAGGRRGLSGSGGGDGDPTSWMRRQSRQDTATAGGGANPSAESSGGGGSDLAASLRFTAQRSASGSTAGPSHISGGGGGVAEEDNNPATPTLHSHWASAAASPKHFAMLGAMAQQRSPPHVQSFGEASSWTAAAAAAAASSSFPTLSPPPPASLHGFNTRTCPSPTLLVDELKEDRTANRNRPLTCPLPPPLVTRYDYSQAQKERASYLTPAERAQRAQRAALDGPFNIRNVDLTSPAKSEGRKPSLILAIEHGTGIEMIEWLLEMQHEAEGPSTDIDNNSVLALAAIHNRCDVIEHYSGHRDVDVASLIESKSASEGRTALHWAAMKGHDAVISMLLSLGANVDAFDNNLSTPLHFASAWGHLTSVQLLKEVGARSDLANKQGFRALDWAFDGNIKIVLQNFGDPSGRSHGHSLSYAASFAGSDGSSTRSPLTTTQHLTDHKTIGGITAELGHARSTVMSRDQIAMQQYRRAAPRMTVLDPAGSTTPAPTGPASSAHGHGGPSPSFGRHRTESDLASPTHRPLVLRSTISSSNAPSTSAGSETRRSSTLSPETLRAAVLARSPPTSPSGGPTLLR